MGMDKDLFNALRKRALGYETEESTIIAGRSGHEKMRIVKKHVPPDVHAIKLMMILEREEPDCATEAEAPM